MKPRRTRYEIIWEILEYCIKPKRITQIIQGCNLNPNSAEKYINILLDKNLLVKEGESYKTTVNGIKFIEEIKRVYEGLFLE
ncbi:MAG: winged helix-turn-helix domain-containing protein [Candidatus Micrarchaeaceae archaeon]